MPPKKTAGGQKTLAELDPMDELSGALKELQTIQDALGLDPEDENFDWTKLSAC